MGFSWTVHTQFESVPNMEKLWVFSSRGRPWVYIWKLFRIGTRGMLVLTRISHENVNYEITSVSYIMRGTPSVLGRFTFLVETTRQVKLG